MTALNPNDTASPALIARRKTLVLRNELLGMCVLASDSLIIVTSGLASTFVSPISSELPFYASSGITTNPTFLTSIALSIVFAIILNLGNDSYYKKSLLDRNIVANILLYWIAAFLILMLSISLFDEYDIIHIEHMEILFVVGLVGLLSSRLGWNYFYRIALNRGLFGRRRILALCEGDVPRSESCVSELQRYGDTSFDTFDIPTSEFETECIRALVQRAKSAARYLQIDEIVAVIPIHRLTIAARIVEELRALPLPVSLVIEDASAGIIFRPTPSFGQTFFFQVQQHPLTRSERIQKRALDIIIALSAMILLAPAMLITALVIKLDSVGPALFKQLRYGTSGNLFRILKFRSMTVMEDGTDFRQVRKEDLRVTRVGRFIRRHSIDELPQLWNVLRGEMSIVGPRPHAIAHDDAYEDRICRYAMRRFMKPGLTGWAQVNGSRGETPTTESMITRLQYDLWYMANWSIWLDITIIARTIIIVIRPKGTY